MRLSRDETQAILQNIHKIESGEINKLRAYNEFKYKDRISKSSYFTVIDKLLVLSRLNGLGVEQSIIDDIAQMMNLYYAWQMYMEVIDID